MRKRIFSMLLALVMMMTMLPALTTEAEAAAKFYWPIATNYKITTGYTAYTNHNGVDMAAPQGTPVYAVHDGTAVFYQAYTTIGGVNYLTSYGNHVWVTGGNGDRTLYAHLNAFNGVSLIIPSSQTRQQSGNSGKHTLASKTVHTGDLLGYVGTTGNSTGNHLHFGYQVNGSYKDPTGYLDRSKCAGDGTTPPPPVPNQLVHDSAYDGVLPLQAYAVSTGRVSVYNSALQMESNRYIDGAADICYILEVYTNKWCRVSYPTGNTRREAYVPLSTFTNGAPSSSWTSDGRYPAYRRTDKNGTIGTVTNGDACKVFATSGGLSQVAYPVTGTEFHKLGWIEKSVAHVHSYSHSVTNPTCTAQGYTTHRCSCGHSYVDSYKDALGHNMSGSVTKQPTCTADGVKTFKCSRCSHQYTEAVAKLGHSYGKTVTNPTCDAKGYTTYKCSRCGDTYKDNYTEPTGHKWDSGKVTKKANCVEDGVKTYTCQNNSSHTKTEVIPKTGHGYAQTVTLPTCETGGYTIFRCINCGHSYKGNETAATGHNWKVQLEIAATCEKEGSITYVCSNNSKHTKTEVIPKADHKEEIAPGKAATCTGPGLTQGSKCTVCGKVLKVQTEIPALGHDYDEGKLTKPNTCKGEGEKTYTCKRDASHTKTEVVPPLNHIKQMVMGKAATCTEPGLTDGEKCFLCGEVLKEQTEIPATGHKDENKDNVCDICGKELMNETRGDMDGNGRLNSDDAIYLLCYTMLPEDYPISQNADIDGNGRINSDDAIYLLCHTMLPDDYPLSK